MKKRLFLGILIFIGVAFIVCIMCLAMFFIRKKDAESPSVVRNDSSNFGISFIRKSHNNMNNENYMISPYSVEMALSMLRDGTNGKTYDEINNVVPERNIKSLAVKDKVNVANAIFIKDKYKNNISNDYLKKLENNHNVDFIYDEFNTPDVINNWVDEETNGMIKRLLDEVDPNFVLGLANAIAMEEKWQEPFECENTSKKEFTLIDGNKYDVSMMSNIFDSSVSYYKDGDSKAVVIPYKKYDGNTGEESKNDGEQLEFIGILPKDINSYINNLDIETIKKIDENKKTAEEDKLNIYVELPKFEYSYDFKNFKNTLMDMGIKRVFSSSKADLSKMIDNTPGVFVSEAIHKSYVKVDESGTEAAAVTYSNLESAASMDVEYVSIIFDRPFIFMIKDVNSNEIAFFGVVYQPNQYEET